MTDTTQLSTISDIAHEACMLEALAEALSVLEDQSTGPEDCPLARRARNSLSPAIDVVIEKARALSLRIDALEAAERAARRTEAAQ